MRFIQAFAALAILVLGASLPAAAQAGAVSAPPATSSASLTNDARIVTSITTEDLKAIIAERGDELLGTGEFGEVSAYAEDETGLIYHLIGTACEEPGVTGCLGLDMQVRFDADELVTWEKINNANLTYQAGKTSRGVNENGVDTLFVTHYVILDGGQNMGNIKTILLNVLSFAPGIRELIWRPT